MRNLANCSLLIFSDEHGLCLIYSKYRLKAVSPLKTKVGPGTSKLREEYSKSEANFKHTAVSRPAYTEIPISK